VRLEPADLSHPSPVSRAAKRHDLRGTIWIDANRRFAYGLAERQYGEQGIHPIVARIVLSCKCGGHNRVEGICNA